jgi:glucokinase
MERSALGIDLGGTNLRLGVVTSAGELRNFVSRPVDWTLSPDEIVQSIAEQARASGYLAQVDGAGLAIAAVVLLGGTIREGLTNLPGIGGYPLADRLAEALQMPCEVGNDANLALRGEVHFGRAKGYDDVLLLTLGTGIGGGLLLGGRLRRGKNVTGGEIGLSLVPDCSTRTIKPIEAIASPGALVRRLRDPRGHLFERAKAGDRLAQELIEEMYEYLGLLIINAHLLLDLQLVLLSGGLATVGEPLREGIVVAVNRSCPPDYYFDLQVELGALPPDAAGVIGAASLWFEREGLLPAI